jgi:hypothetical protein
MIDHQLSKLIAINQDNLHSNPVHIFFRALGEL